MAPKRRRKKTRARRITKVTKTFAERAIEDGAANLLSQAGTVHGAIRALAAQILRDWPDEWGTVISTDLNEAADRAEAYKEGP